MRIYGPVPSRRFGLSLGVDIVPHKTCPYDCIYCQLGSTDSHVAEPSRFYEIEEILRDVAQALEEGPTPDVITMAGSGEPTLYSDLGDLIVRLKALSGVPILLITNAALLWRDDVKRAALQADILAPSLDAGDPLTFEKVNRPHTDITFERMLEGLKDVTFSHKGEIRLEVMLVKGVNDSDESIDSIARILGDIRFDRIDINTPVRPPVPERGAMPCDEEVLSRAMKAFGPKAYPIGNFQKREDVESSKNRQFDDRDKDIIEMLRRRPCTRMDISNSLGISLLELVKILQRLTETGFTEEVPRGSEVFYKAKDKLIVLRKS